MDPMGSGHITTVLGPEISFVRGWVIFVPAVARLFCLAPWFLLNYTYVKQNQIPGSAHVLIVQQKIVLTRPTMHHSPSADCSPFCFYCGTKIQLRRNFRLPSLIAKAARKAEEEVTGGIESVVTTAGRKSPHCRQWNGME